MLIAIVPLVAAIVGILIYVLSANTKVVEIGRALMWTGFLVTLFVAASQRVSL